MAAKGTRESKGPGVSTLGPSMSRTQDPLAAVRALPSASRTKARRDPIAQLLETPAGVTSAE